MLLKADEPSVAKIEGRQIGRVPRHEQILSLLTSDRGKKTSQLSAAIKGHPKAINTKLTDLVETGEIVKVQRGVNGLSEI